MELQDHPDPKDAVESEVKLETVDHKEPPEAVDSLDHLDQAVLRATVDVMVKQELLVSLALGDHLDHLACLDFLVERDTEVSLASLENAESRVFQERLVQSVPQVHPELLVQLAPVVSLARGVRMVLLDRQVFVVLMACLDNLDPQELWEDPDLLDLQE